MNAPSIADIRAWLPTDIAVGADAVRELTGGWVSWTFDVDDTWIVQIPRRADDIASTRKQVALLPALAQWVPFRVPEPKIIAYWGERPVVCYRKVPGRPLRAGDDIVALASMLCHLHSFPADRAADLTGSHASVVAWHDDYDALYERIRREVLPLLATDLAHAVRRGYERRLSDGFEFEPSLVHRDLGAPHILIDDDTGRLAGVIDFESASVGDPAIDFVGLLITLGPDRARAVVDAYGAGVTWAQAVFYWWLAPVHDILHGRAIGDDEIVRDGVDGLASRLAVVGG